MHEAEGIGLLTERKLGQSTLLHEFGHQGLADKVGLGTVHGDIIIEPGQIGLTVFSAEELEWTGGLIVLIHVGDMGNILTKRSQILCKAKGQRHLHGSFLLCLLLKSLCILLRFYQGCINIAWHQNSLLFARYACPALLAFPT
ncbi:hypothetical protein D3C78_787750 [compost metagenome]